MEQITKMMPKSQTPNDRPNDGYGTFLHNLSHRIETIDLVKNTRLFRTHNEDLWDIFISNLPEDARQHYICNTCHGFVRRYGGLVTINEDGSITSVIWDPGSTPELFKNSVEALKKKVESSKISGVFCSKDSILGTPCTGEWNHMYANLPYQLKADNPLYRPNEIEAEYLEKFKTVMNALKEYTPNTVTTAINIIDNDALFAGDKVLGVAKWFNKVITMWYSNLPSATKTRLLWREVAMAPTGYCHIKSSMIGTLLDDIQDDSMDLDAIRRRFADKMDPLKYMRPQAAPAEANIKRAEEIFAKLGLEKSLDRRFATIDDIDVKLWESKKEEEPRQEGVLFGHLKAKDAINNNNRALLDGLPFKRMTWDRFRQDILPNAVSIEAKLDYSRMNFSTFLTQTNDDAAPILKWDKVDKRNPVSFYLYRNGSTCTSKNIAPGFNEIVAICYDPVAWYSDKPYDIPGNGANFIVKGARDLTGETGNVGIALFPEDLIPELHEVRSTIEAYSRSARITLSSDGTGCVALKMPKDFAYDIKLRVKMDDGRTLNIMLDRWI